MSANTRKDNNAIIERALRIGLEQAASSDNVPPIEIRWTPRLEKMVLELANLLGFSVRMLLNAALRYALHEAKRQRIQPNELQTFPKRLRGRVTPLELSIETASQVREKLSETDIPGCTVAGIKLLHERLL